MQSRLLWKTLSNLLFRDLIRKFLIFVSPKTTFTNTIRKTQQSHKNSSSWKTTARTENGGRLRRKDNRVGH